MLLPMQWQSQAAHAINAEKRALHRYLEGQECCQACLSAYLDLEPEWRQCREGEDVVCDVCSSGLTKVVSPLLIKGLQEPIVMLHTSSAVI